MKPNFSIVLIARNEEQTLPRLLSSLEEFKGRGGEVCLLDTGSTDKTVQIARDWGCGVEEVGEKYLHTVDKELADKINTRFLVDEPDIVKEGDKYFDFSGARNHAASLASNDWVSFADCDEELTKLDIDKINKIIENKELAHLSYDFVFSHDQFGKPAINFTQSKFYNRNKIAWKNLVHEIISPINGGGKEFFLSPDIFRLEHWQQPGDRHSYLIGLAVDCFLHQDSDRNSHYFARELLWSGRPKSAIKEFERHVSMNGWPAERCQSLVFMGDCWGALNNPEKQAEAYAKAFYVDSSRREPLIKLGYFYLHNKNWLAAISMAKAAMEIPWSAFYANDRSHYEHVPHEILYQAMGWRGDIEGAQKHLLEAMKFLPYHPQYLRDTKYYFPYYDHGIEGWMSFPEILFLYNLSKKYRNVAEIGSWKGRSTHALLSGGAQITAIDTWKGSEFTGDDTNWMAKKEDILATFKKNVKGFKNLKIDVNKSLDAAKNYKDGEFEAVFIDAGHRYEDVLEDIEAWLPKATKFICGHDYKPDVWMGVIKAVDEVFGKPDGVEDSIWWVDLEKRLGKSQTIPKDIYTFWLSENELPEDLKKYIESQKIPGYRHHLVGLKDIPKDIPIPYVQEAIAAKKWVKAVDYLKMWYIYHHGGIVMDADVEILPGKNFDDMLDNQMFVAKEENGFLGYSLVGGIKGHPLAKQYLEEVPKKFKGSDDLNFESSMEVFTHLGYADKTVKVYDPEYFFPYNWQTGVTKITPNTRSFHHFLMSWVPKERQDTYKDPGIDGWMAPEELQFLYKTAKDMNSICEMGSWKGRSTHALLSGCRGQITAIDTFKGSKDPLDWSHEPGKTQDIYAQFQKNVGHFKNLTTYTGESLEISKRFSDKSFDMVFIDAGHTYEEVRDDIRAWKNKAKILLCGHDYVDTPWMGVWRAVDEELGGPDEVHGTIWVKWLNKPRVSICIPHLGRPEKLHRLITEIKKTAGYDNYEILVGVDDYPPNNKGVPKVLKELVERSSGELIMYLGNDVIPQQDFLKLAVFKMLSEFPEADGLVGLNDSYWKLGEIATHFLISKKLLPYLDGEIFHTGYYHCGCDNELTERCRKIGKYVWAENAKIYHDHPVQNGFQVKDMDKTYELAYRQDRMEHDRDLLHQRAALLGFELRENFTRPPAVENTH